MSITLQVRIMDISLNLARMGNWTADSYESKEALIKKFMDQTERYIVEMPHENFSKDMEALFNRFVKKFEELKKEKIDSKTKDIWAEKALTWANILQHRAKLA